MVRVKADPLPAVPASECSTELVVFMPFVAFSQERSGADPVRAGGWPAPRAEPDRSGPTWQWCDPRSPSQPSTRRDLVLWDYSDSLIDELTTNLPHRTWVQEVSVDRAPPLPPHPFVTWTPQLCAVELWSIGVGQLTVVYRLDRAASQRASDTAPTWQQIRESVVGLEAKRSLLLAADLIVAASLEAAFEMGPAPPPTLNSGGVRGTKLQWVQQLFIVSADRERTSDELDDTAARLTDDGHRLKCRVDRGRAQARLGVEACIAANPGASELRDALVRVIATQTSVWASVLELDRILLKQLRKVTTRGARLPTRDLEKRASILLHVFERVQRFRATVSTMRVHLATIDRDVWERVNEVWRLGDQFESLETKLNAVELVQRNLVDTLTTRQGRVLNQVVLLITMSSLVSLVLSTWDFTHKAFDPFTGSSIVIFGVAIVIAVLPFFYLNYRMGRTTVGFLAARRRPRA